MTEQDNFVPYITKQELFEQVVAIVKNKTGGGDTHQSNNQIVLSEENPRLSVSFDQSTDQPVASVFLTEEHEEYCITEAGSNYEMTLNGKSHKPLVRKAQEERRKISALLQSFLPKNPDDQIS